MSLRIIIIDDERDAIETLESIIGLFHTKCEIVGKTTNPFEGLTLIQQFKPDVVFLDIMMPEMNGFQLLENLLNIDFEIIFTTAFDHYAIRAIKKNALDYILKPIEIPEVLNALDKVEKKKGSKENITAKFKNIIDEIKTPKTQRIKIPIFSGFEFVNIDDLIRLEAEGSYTYAYIKKRGKLLISKSVKEMETSLDTAFFFRTHRSHIINTSHVIRYDRDHKVIMMSDDSMVPLSRRRIEAFNAFLDECF